VDSLVWGSIQRGLYGGGRVNRGGDVRGQSSGRPDNRGRAGPETAAVSRGPILTNHSGHTKTDEEKQRMSDETNDQRTGRPMADGLERAEPPGKKTVAGASSWEVDDA